MTAQPVSLEPTREQMIEWFERTIGLTVAEDDDDPKMYRAILLALRASEPVGERERAACLEGAAAIMREHEHEETPSMDEYVEDRRADAAILARLSGAK